MNLSKRIYPTTIAAILVLACVAGAQVASSVGAAPAEPPSSSNVSFSSPRSAEVALRSALARSRYGSNNGSSGVFVVPAAEISAEDLAAINEDVNVMTRIFEKKLRQANLLPPASPFPLFVGSDYRRWGANGGSTRTMYLQGYGVLFMMDVPFPLAPGPETEKAEEPTTEAQSDIDPVWASARDEIYEPHRSDRDKSRDKLRPQYDAQQVENLKATIINALVHAANIRTLTPNESIIVTLTGIPASTVKVAGTIAIPGTGQVVEGSLAENAPTVLTIRAKVADIKACAQGQLGEQQFRQRVQVLSHPMLSSATDFSSTILVAPGGGSSGISR